MEKITIKLTPFHCLAFLKMREKIINTISNDEPNASQQIAVIIAITTQMKNKIFTDLTVGSTHDEKTKSVVDFLNAIKQTKQSIINH